MSIKPGFKQLKYSFKLNLFPWMIHFREKEFRSVSCQNELISRSNENLEFIIIIT